MNGATRHKNFYFFAGLAVVILIGWGQACSLTDHLAAADRNTLACLSALKEVKAHLDGWSDVSERWLAYEQTVVAQQQAMSEAMTPMVTLAESIRHQASELRDLEESFEAVRVAYLAQVLWTAQLIERTHPERHD